ncbi:MAG: DUF5622 domain-containing protein [Desulfurococcaceae archaeon]|uniref:Cren protein n=1 Tax=Staphylothermus marinus TaxID=2280 RepID=A0A7C4JLS3_STAMA
MGLKHSKYVYVRRSDGLFVKVRVLNIRFNKKSGLKERGKQIERVVFDVTDPSRYIVLPYKTSKPPHNSIVIDVSELPREIATIIETV